MTLGKHFVNAVEDPVGQAVKSFLRQDRSLRLIESQRGKMHRKARRLSCCQQILIWYQSFIINKTNRKSCCYLVAGLDMSQLTQVTSEMECLMSAFQVTYSHLHRLLKS